MIKLNPEVPQPTTLPDVIEVYAQNGLMKRSVGKIMFTQMLGHQGYAFKPHSYEPPLGYMVLQDIIEELKRLNNLRKCGY